MIRNPISSEERLRNHVEALEVTVEELVAFFQSLSDEFVDLKVDLIHKRVID